MAAEMLSEGRASNRRYDLNVLLRQSVYASLEGEGILYAIRLKRNGRLEEHIEHLLTRPVGRPPVKPRVFYREFYYRAASWDRSRRVIAKVEWHRGELILRVGFIVTNLSKSPKNAFRFEG